MSDQDAAASAKIPRDRIVLLHIEATPVATLCGCVLDALRDAGLPPVDIELQHDGRALAINMTFDGRRALPSTVMLRRLDRLPAVKWVEMRDRTGAPFGRPNRGR
ncbi:hypothetical protein [Sphingopyxis sp. 550A]